VLCNHQRAVPKTHEKSMQKMLDDIEKATVAYEKLKKDLALVKAGKPLQDGKNASLETCGFCSFRALLVPHHLCFPAIGRSGNRSKQQHANASRFIRLCHHH
jgi:hypothetical protein